MNPVASCLAQHVLLTPGTRKALRAGWAWQQGLPAHRSARQIAKKAGVPAAVAGSACGVKGYRMDLNSLPLAQYLSLIEALFSA